MERRLAAIAWFAVTAAFLAAPVAVARPLYAARTGMPCARCHIDPDGGGMRNGTGFTFALNGHTMEPSEEHEESSINPHFADGIRLGADLRYAYLQDAHNKQSKNSTFFLMSSKLFIAADLNSRVSFTYANDLGATQEAYALIRNLPLDGTVKVGQFRPPYGLQEEDHTTFTQDSLGIGNPKTPYAYDQGAEVSVAHGIRTMSVAVVNGGHGRFGDNNQEKAVVGRASCFTDRVGLGLSGFANSHGPTAVGTEASRLYMGGVFGHLHQGPFVLLAEYDRAQINPETVGPIVKQEAGFAELSYLVVPRATVKLKYDRFDRNLDVARSARDRIGLWLETDLAEFTRLLLAVRGTRAYGYDASANPTSWDTIDIVGQLYLSF